MQHAHIIIRFLLLLIEKYLVSYLAVLVNTDIKQEHSFSINGSRNKFFPRGDRRISEISMLYTFMH